MAEDIKRQFARISIAMLGVGIGIGLSAYLMWQWIDAIVWPTLSGTGKEVLGDLAPLIFLIVATVGSPIVAGMIGIFEGLRESTVKQALLVGVACLVGAALMITIAGIFISFTGVESSGGGGGDEGVGFTDLISLAGLGSIASFITAFFTTKFGAR